MRNSSFAESDTPEIRQESVLEWTRIPLCQKCVCLLNHTIINNKNKLLKLAMVTWFIQVVKSCDQDRFRTSDGTIIYIKIVKIWNMENFLNQKDYFYLQKLGTTDWVTRDRMSTERNSYELMCFYFKFYLSWLSM